MMRFVLFCLLLPMSAAATEVWRGTLPVEVGPTAVDLPVLLEVDAPDDPEASLGLTVFAETTPLIAPLQALLEAELRGLGNNCEKRVSTPGVSVAMAGNQIRMSAQVRAEIWLCGLIKTRLGRETGQLSLAIAPGVRQGRLHFTLRACRLAGLDAIARALGAEGKVCTRVQSAVARLNAKADLVEPPLDLRAAGFGYSTLQVFQAGDQSILIGGLEGPNDGAGLLRFLSGR